MHNRIRVITGLLIAVVFAFGACSNEGEVPQSPTVQDSIAVDTTLVTMANESPNPEYHHYRDYKFSPYSNGTLDERLSPEQVDFSAHFLEYLKPKEGMDDLVANEIVKSADYTTVWAEFDQRMGVLGTNYQRIDVAFTHLEATADSFQTYTVKGYSKVGSNQCDFEGTIKLLYAVDNECVEYGGVDYEGGHEHIDWCGYIVYQYQFREKECKTGGLFKGIGCSEIVIEDAKAYTDSSSEVADGYANNDFVGIWKSSKTGQEKKCIWGDYRLPYTFDFDIGDGEMYINPKYRQYGWHVDSTTSGWWLPND